MIKPTRYLTLLVAALAGFGTIRAATPVVDNQLSASLTSAYESKVVQEGVVQDATANSVTDLGLTYSIVSLDVVAYAPTEVSTKVFHSRLGREDYIASLKLVDLSFADLVAGYDYRQYRQLPNAKSEASQQEPFIRVDTKGFAPIYVITRYDVPTRTTNLEGGVSLPINVFAGFKVTPSAYLGYNDIANEYPHTLKAIANWSRYYGGGAALSHSILGGTASVGVYDQLADHGDSSTARWYTVSYGVRI